MEVLLDGIPKRYAKILRDRLWNGYSFGEIADMYCQEYESVRSLYRRAIKKAKEEMDDIRKSS